MDTLELALDDCLQQLAAGTSSLGQCLERYPQFAKELRPLLEAALRLRPARLVRPPSGARDRVRAKLGRHIELHPRRTMRPVLRMAVGMVALALTLIVAGTAAAQSALPGETLYQWKLSTERAWRAAAPDPLAVDLSLADRRADELLQVSRDPQHNALDEQAESEGIAAYTDALNRLDVEADSAHDAQVLTALEKHQEKFSAAGIHVPQLDDIVSHGKSQQDHGKSPTNKP